MKKAIEIFATDNYPLSAFLFEPSSTSLGTILLCTGLGIPKEFYEKYCAFLAAEGYVALVFDYRGIGKKEQAAKNKAINLQNWGSKDMVGALNWLKANYPEQKTYCFGHSIGGQVAGLMENHHLVERFIFFSTTTGYWTVFNFPTNFFTIFMFYIHIPITTRLFGYLPKSLTYRGVRIAKGVALEWAKWSRNKNYIRGFLNKTIPKNYYENITQKIDVIWFKDDPIATERAVSSMLTYYTNAEIARHLFDPKVLGLPRMGHSGFFSKKGQPLWEFPLKLLKEQT